MVFLAIEGAGAQKRKLNYNLTRDKNRKSIALQSLFELGRSLLIQIKLGQLDDKKKPMMRNTFIIS